MEIVDAFFERFNAKQSPLSIAAALHEEFGYSLLDTVEQEVFCAALIDCFWQVGAPTIDCEQLLNSLDAGEALKAYWRNRSVVESW